MGAHIGIQRQLALFHQAHHAQRGDELRDRGDAIHRVAVCSDAFFRCCIGNKFAAKLAFKHHAAITNDEC